MNWNVWQYPQKVEPIRSAFPEADLDWLAIYPDQVFDFERLREYPQAIRGQDPSEITVSESITLDKWLPIFSDQVFDFERLREHQQAVRGPDPSELPAEAITLDKWLPSFPDQVFEIERFGEYQAFFKDYLTEVDRIQNGEISPRAIYPDETRDAGWLLEYPQAVRGPDPSEIGIGPEVITIDKWLPSFPDQVFEIARAHEYQAFFRVGFEQEFFVDPVGWASIYQDVVLGTEGLHDYPQSVRGPDPSELPAGIVFQSGLDHWLVPSSGKDWQVPSSGKDWQVPSSGKDWNLE